MSPRLGVVDSLRSARTRLLLRGATRVGRSPKLSGQPVLMNQGSIEIGDDFFFSARPAPSHLAAAEGARILIGNRVRIAYGAAISARAAVIIGEPIRVFSTTEEAVEDGRTKVERALESLETRARRVLCCRGA